MNYEQVNSFLTVVELNSLSKAANQLHITQSSVSKRIKSLEEELKINLIVRDKGIQRISLTQAGEKFCAYAREFKDAYLHLEMFKTAQNKTDFLRVASVDSINNTILANLYPKLMDKCPELKLTITTNQTAYIYEMVANREIDLGFVLAEYHWSGVEVIPIFKQRFKLLKYSLENIENLEPVSPSELDSEKEIFQPFGSLYMQYHDYWWPERAYRIKLDTVSMMETPLFKEGNWTIVPESVSDRFINHPHFYVLELNPAPEERQCYMIWNKNRSPNTVKASSEFEKIIKEYFTNKGN